MCPRLQKWVPSAGRRSPVVAGQTGAGPGSLEVTKRRHCTSLARPRPAPCPGRLLLMAQQRGLSRGPAQPRSRTSMSGTRASNDRPPGSGGVKRGRLQQEAAATGSRVTVVLGAQWGDEGKGKVVDLLATDADIISRCQVRALPPPSKPPPSLGPGALSSRSPTWTRLLDASPPWTASPRPPDPSTRTHSPPPHSPHCLPCPAPPLQAVGQGGAINACAELGTPDLRGWGGVLHGRAAGPSGAGGGGGGQLLAGLRHPPSSLSGPDHRVALGGQARAGRGRGRTMA